MVGGQPSTLNVQPSTLLYSGEQFDTDLQNYYLRARYYDPSNGRFNRLDPFAGNNYDPQSLHKYAYAHQDAINNADPSGLSILLLELIGQLLKWGLRTVETVVKTIAKRIAQKKALMISGAVTGFIFGVMGGLFNLIAGFESDLVLLGVMGAVVGAMQGLLSPMRLKISALYGFVSGFIGTLTYDYLLTGKIDRTTLKKAGLAGLLGGLAAVAGAIVGYMVGPCCGNSWFTKWDAAGNYLGTVPTEKVVDVLAETAGFIFEGLVAAFLSLIPEVIFTGSPRTKLQPLIAE